MIFNVGLGDVSVFGHNNKNLSANHSDGYPVGLIYSSSVGPSNGPLSLYQRSSIAMAKI